MNMKKNLIKLIYGKFEINAFISEMIRLKVVNEDNPYTFASCAEALNIGESFFRKACNGNKQFNVKHLILLSNYMKFDLNDVYPTPENIELVTGRKISNEMARDLINSLAHPDEYKPPISDDLDIAAEKPR